MDGSIINLLQGHGMHICAGPDLLHEDLEAALLVEDKS